MGRSQYAARAQHRVPGRAELAAHVASGKDGMVDGGACCFCRFVFGVVARCSIFIASA